MISEQESNIFDSMEMFWVIFELKFIYLIYLNRTAMMFPSHEHLTTVFDDYRMKAFI